MYIKFIFIIIKPFSSYSSIKDRHISSSRESPLLSNSRVAASQTLPRQQSQTYKRNPGVSCQGCLRSKYHVQVSFEIHLTFQGLRMAGPKIPILSSGLLQNLLHQQICCARETERVQTDIAENSQFSRDEHGCVKLGYEQGHERGFSILQNSKWNLVEFSLDLPRF